MIKNIIFDMVGVVIRFDTEKYYNDHGIGITDRELLNREVLYSILIRTDRPVQKPCVTFQLRTG